MQPLNRPFYQFSHLQNGDCDPGGQGVVSNNECLEARRDLQIHGALGANEPLLSNAPERRLCFPQKRDQVLIPDRRCLLVASGCTEAVDSTGFHSFPRRVLLSGPLETQG